MVAVSGVNGAVALTLLKAGSFDAGTPAGFMASSVFSANGDVVRGINDAFAAKPQLQADYDAFYKEEMSRVAPDGTRISSDNGKHIALVHTIMANRADFPPQEFHIRTDLGDGAFIDTTIEAATSSSAAETFKTDQAKRTEKFEASQASAEAERNAKQSRNDLIAQGKIIDTLTLDGAEKDQASNAALAILKDTSPDDPVASQARYRAF